MGGLNLINQMKKITLLLLLSPFVFYSQEINFGVKTGVALSYYNFEDIGTIRADAAPYFGAIGEYKSDNIGLELEFNYTASETKTNNRDIGGLDFQDKLDTKSLFTALNFKIYPVEAFAIKIGGYFNSVDAKYTLNDEKIDYDMKDYGILFGMEVYVYKGLFLDTRLMFDINDNDSIKSEHIMFGAGYKF